MRNRDYFSYSLIEYLLMGRQDALNGINKDVKDMIKALKGMSEDYIIDRVKNYLIGFELGTLQCYLSDMRLSSVFDEESCTLTFDRDVLPDEEQKERALSQARQLLVRYGRRK